MSEAFFEKVEELNRDFAVFSGVMSPKQASTKLFLKLINKLSDDINQKHVLDLGCGTGVLAIALARNGAKVVAVDINENAIKNTKFNIEQEEKNVQDNINLYISDLYSGDLRFDFIVFNNPTIKGLPVHKTTSSDSFAGDGFEVNKRALNNLPNILKEKGSGYFLVIESKNKLPGIWTQEHLKKALPKGFTFKKATEEIEIDKSLGLSYCIYQACSP